MDLSRVGNVVTRMQKIASTSRSRTGVRRPPGFAGDTWYSRARSRLSLAKTRNSSSLVSATARRTFLKTREHHHDFAVSAVDHPSPRTGVDAARTARARKNQQSVRTERENQGPSEKCHTGATRHVRRRIATTRVDLEVADGIEDELVSPEGIEPSTNRVRVLGRASHVVARREVSERIWDAEDP